MLVTLPQELLEDDIIETKLSEDGEEEKSPAPSPAVMVNTSDTSRYHVYTKPTRLPANKQPAGAPSWLWPGFSLVHWSGAVQFS
jgi:hypothetical protein